MAGMEQALANMRADKAGATRDQEIHGGRLANQRKGCRASRDVPSFPPHRPGFDSAGNHADRFILSDLSGGLRTGYPYSKAAQQHG
jgi:hypothetical protein